MASLTLESNLPDAEQLEIINGPPIRVAAGADALRLPIPTFDEVFAESPDTEGGRRVRSRPQLAEGGGKVYFDADDGQTFWEAIDLWQTTIAAMNSHGGMITYEPPDGTPVTYEVESIRITSLPQDGVQLRRRHAESEWVFMARPYGLLDTQEIVPADDPYTWTDPIGEIPIPNVIGSVDARGRLILTDLEGVDYSHVVWGLDTNYDPDNPTPILLAADPSGFSVTSDTFDDSFAGVADTEGGFDVIRATLTTTPLVICGSGSQQHIATWRHLVRLFGEGSGPIWVRLVYKLGSSPRFSEGDWKQLQGLGAFYERDLGLMNILEAVQGTRTCEWRIEAYSETAGDTLAIHLDQLIPQPGGKARTELSVGTPTASEGPESGATFADDSSIGTFAWTNPGNAAASDGSKVTAIPAIGDTTHYLKATNFGFSIPSGATITGIKVEVERSTAASSPAASDAAVRLVKGGTIQPTDRAASGAWPVSDTYETYGGDSDLWGVPWLFTEVNASNFGVVLAAIGGGSELRIDHIRITVYYTEAADEPDRVLHANQSMEVRSDKIIREHPTNEEGRIASEGAYLKISPTGREGRVSRLVVKARRNDVDSLPDDVIDDEISASLEVTPRVSLLGA